MEIVEGAYNSIYDAWDAWMYPPTPSQLMRQSRSKILRLRTKFTRNLSICEDTLKKKEKELAGIVESSTSDDVARVARGIAREMQMRTQFLNACNALDGAEMRLITAEATVGVKESMTSASRALGFVTEGGLEGANAETQHTLRELDLAEEIGNNINEALSGGESLETDEMVESIIDKARVARLVEDLPSVGRPPGPQPPNIPASAWTPNLYAAVEERYERLKAS